jgi:hypothetical protein
VEKSTKTNPKSFESPITQKGGLPYINLKLSPLPLGQQLIIKNERKQTTSHDSTNSTIGHIRSKTSQWQQRHMDDEQTRIHRAHPQALEESTLHTFNNRYPINTEDYRKTIIRQPGKEKIIIEDD